MKPTILFFLLFTGISYGQTLGKLYYNTTPRTDVAPPIRERQKLMTNREARYYENREYCNQIENLLIDKIHELSIDSINQVYRGGLHRNLKQIQTMKAEGNYADYSISLMDVMDNIEDNNLNFEDEDEYRNQLLEERIRMQSEETQRLKQELEYQKSLNKPKVSKKIIKQ
jgi:hypothetical protein